MGDSLVADDVASPTERSGETSIPKPLLYAVLVLAVAALGTAGYRALVQPWHPYGDGDMSYLDRVDKRSLSGGDLTHYHFGKFAYEQRAPNLAWGWDFMFEAGDGVFERRVSPAVLSRARYDADGLGPIYNHTACLACHIADGRAQPVASEEGIAQEGLLMRLSVPGNHPDGAPTPHPVYGGQLGDRGIPVQYAKGKDGRRKVVQKEVRAEGVLIIRYEEIAGQYVDGTPYTLTKPVYEITNLSRGPIGADTMFSPRIANMVSGIGLLEAIPEETILAMADPKDENGDGISGRPQMVRHPDTGELALGRFGWKAETASVKHQVAAAAVNDMGMTSSMFIDEPCTKFQPLCNNARSGNDGSGPEYTDEQITQMENYVQLLGVPGRRGVREERTQRGEAAFRAANCTGCHIETLVTGGHEIERLNGQTIHPYTDMLLHDMGKGLADERPSWQASGHEWRTPPLWGIGLVPVVNGHTRFLHDGRARNLEEAVLWHGGEAKKSRDAFLLMDKQTRADLIYFLESL
ncbi:MAG: di-heme oxidoredictase family protein [Pseudomonadota bacterium]